MALTVSPQIRIVALLGLVLAVGFVGTMKLMGGGDAGSVSAVVPAQNSAVVRAKDVAARASQRAKAPATPMSRKTVASKPAAAQKPVAPAQEVMPSRGAERMSAALAAGLPPSLAAALAQSPTVVALVYNPQAQVDGIAFAEAQAGAALAGVGFVSLNVLSRAQIGKLTEQLGILPDPAVLVFTRPATLAARIDGFADKETVAQAAHNAARGT